MTIVGAIRTGWLLEIPAGRWGHCAERITQQQLDIRPWKVGATSQGTVILEVPDLSEAELLALLAAEDADALAA